MERNPSEAVDKILKEAGIDLEEPGFFVRHAWIFLEVLVIFIAILILIFL
jgi:hypothetical protein